MCAEPLLILGGLRPLGSLCSSRTVVNRLNSPSISTRFMHTSLYICACVWVGGCMDGWVDGCDPKHIGKCCNPAG